MGCNCIVLLYSFIIVEYACGILVDPRWVKVPESHNSVFKESERSFIWQFQDESYDKAEVTVIHAPPDLHYEYSVVSEDVEIRGPPQTLRVYYHHFIGRVGVTYYSYTITLTITKSTITDKGEIFVQVNFPGQVPLTSSTFLEVYQKPQWLEPPDSLVISGRGEDASFSMALERVDFSPPLEKVMVTYVANSSTGEESVQNGTMIITPPSVYGSLEIRCQPFVFHRYLRYIGDAELSNLRFLVTNISREHTGHYHVTVVYGKMNFSLAHITEVTQSEAKQDVPVYDITTINTEQANTTPSDDKICRQTACTPCSMTAVSVMAVIMSSLVTVLAILFFMKLHKYRKESRSQMGDILINGERMKDQD